MMWYKKQQEKIEQKLNEEKATYNRELEELEQRQKKREEFEKRMLIRRSTSFMMNERRKSLQVRRMTVMLNPKDLQMLTDPNDRKLLHKKSMSSAMAREVLKRNSISPNMGVRFG